MTRAREVSTATGVESPSDEHHSLALPTLLRTLERLHKARVLDLGPATGSNVRFFGALPCSLYIADLPYTLFPGPGAAATMRHESFASIVKRELPCDQSYQVVLAWDLLNYLDLDEIAALGRRLAVVCSPGATLFGLISTHKTMPNRPSVFKILGPDRLGYELDTGVRRAAPRYKEPDLARALPDFAVDSSYLMRNGMQEYLFTRREAPALS